MEQEGENWELVKNTKGQDLDILDLRCLLDTALDLSGYYLHIV